MCNELITILEGGENSSEEWLGQKTSNKIWATTEKSENQNVLLQSILSIGRKNFWQKKSYFLPMAGDDGRCGVAVAVVLRAGRQNNQDCFARK